MWPPSVLFAVVLLFVAALMVVSSTRRRHGSPGWHHVRPMLVCRSCGEGVPLTDELRDAVLAGPTRCPACHQGLFTKAW